MLQQTTVAAVIPYFDAFLSRWPSVDALAAAPLEEVLAAWAGLGYYARARNLHACAKAVAERGGFPETASALQTLPGIGAYTSAAIAAIAFEEPVAAIDGNVERVAARLLTLEKPPKREAARIAAAVGAMVPADRPGDFAQAIMELGATLCTPKKPACPLCPLRPDCAAAAAGDPEAYPVKAPKRARAAWYGRAFVPHRPDGAILLRRRPPKGLLGGMLEPFGSPWTDHMPGMGDAPFSESWIDAGAVEHGFTHAVLSVTVHVASVPHSAPTPACGAWHNPHEVRFATLMRKIVTRALATDALAGASKLPS